MARLKIDILADGSQASRTLDGLGGRVGKFGKTLAIGAAAGAAGVAVAAGSIALSAVQSASRVEQAYGATDSVFGKYAARVKNTAEGAAESVGLASSEYAELANVLGAQLKNMGTSADKLAPKTDQLIKQGADLAATFGGSTADAVSAVSSLLKGERDPIERYGVSIKAADVSARLAAQGLDKLEGPALAAAQAQATLALLTEQTSSAQGAFARESDTAAGQQQRLTAQWENAKTSLGQGLLPTVTKVATFLSTTAMPAVLGLADYLSEKLGPGTARAGAFFTTTLVPAISRVASFITGTMVPAARQFLAWFQDKIVPGIRAAVLPVLAGLRTAFGNVQAAIERNRPQLEKIGQLLKTVAEFIAQKVAPVVGTILGGAFQVLGKILGGTIDGIGKLVDGIERAVEWIQRLKDKLDSIKGGIGDKLGKLNPFGFAATGAVTQKVAAAGLVGATALSSPMALASTSTSSSSGADLPALYVDARPVEVRVQIDVHGATDRVATARELRKLLEDLELWEGKR